MTDEDRTNQIANAMGNLVKPGEAWIIRKSEDSEIEVVREGTSKLAATNPELYGRLLRVSEQLSNAGGSMCIWGPIVVIGLCIGIHLHWFDTILGASAEKFRSVWFYILAAVASFFLFGGLARSWERFKYRQCRDALLRTIEDARISPHRLIADIEGDDAVENLADQLKEDPNIV